MIALRKPMISVGLLLGIATQVASLALAGENLSVEPEALEVVESAEFAELYQNDPAPIFRAEADSLLATLAMEQNAKLREATMNAYRQLVSELEMYDDETRVVDTSPRTIRKPKAFGQTSCLAPKIEPGLLCNSV